MTDHRTPVERSMNEKILNIMKGDGEGDGLTLTPAEATAFKLMMGAMHQRQVEADSQLTLAQGVNTAMLLALYRKRLQVIHEEHEDGTVSFDLQPAPPDPLEETPATVN